MFVIVLQTGIRRSTLLWRTWKRTTTWTSAWSRTSIFSWILKKFKFRVYKINQPGEAEREGGERLRERYAERLRERERLKLLD